MNLASSDAHALVGMRIRLHGGSVRRAYDATFPDTTFDELIEWMEPLGYVCLQAPNPAAATARIVGLIATASLVIAEHLRQTVPATASGTDDLELARLSRAFLEAYRHAATVDEEGLADDIDRRAAWTACDDRAQLLHDHLSGEARDA